MNNLCHRREAVGRARRVRDDVVFGRIVFVLVDAEHDCYVFILRRRGDDHFPDGATQVLARVFGFGEKSGRLDHDLRAHRFPVDCRRISLREHAKLPALNLDAAFRGADLVMQIPEDGIVFEQVRERLCVRQIVYGHKVNIRVAD